VTPLGLPGQPVVALRQAGKRLRKRL